VKECPWCHLQYDLTPETEPSHLSLCPVFQGLPAAQVVNGKVFVALPNYPSILVERPSVN
jgi:hypothetical protein